MAPFIITLIAAIVLPALIWVAVLDLLEQWRRL
jgi:hypothetical protein